MNSREPNSAPSLHTDLFFFLHLWPTGIQKLCSWGFLFCSPWQWAQPSKFLQKGIPEHSNSSSNPREWAYLLLRISAAAIRSSFNQLAACPVFPLWLLFSYIKWLSPNSPAHYYHHISSGWAENHLLKSFTVWEEGGCTVFLLLAGFMGSVQAEICDFTLIARWAVPAENRTD